MNKQLTPGQRRAIEQRAAALAKHAATPKPAPRPTPIRLGEHVRLRWRVIKGPKPLRAAVKGRSKA